ncbi:hypothetical protein [Streptomyces sp. QTS52]
MGIAWTQNGTPIIAVQTTEPDRDAAADHPPVAETARLLGEALG